MALVTPPSPVAAPMEPVIPEISLGRYFRVLRQQLGLLFLFALIGVGGGHLGSKVITPLYEAEATLVPTKQKGSGSDLASSLGGLGSLMNLTQSGASDKEVAIATLKSRFFIESFIRDEKLLPVLFAKKWDADKGTWKVENPDNAPTYADGYRYFKKKVLTVVDAKGLVNLRVRWQDRIQAATWANLLISRINKTMQEKAVRESSLSLQYLEEEYRKTSVVDLQQAIAKIMEMEIKNSMLARVQEEYAFKVIDPAPLLNANEVVTPTHLMMLLIGGVLGLLLGVFVALVRQGWRRA